MLLKESISDELSILLVSTDQEVAEEIGAYLDKWGFPYSYARNDQSAVRHFTGSPYSLVIIDQRFRHLSKSLRKIEDELNREVTPIFAMGFDKSSNIDLPEIAESIIAPVTVRDFRPMVLLQ